MLSECLSLHLCTNLDYVGGLTTSKHKKRRDLEQGNDLNLLCATFSVSILLFKEMKILIV